ncbi:hypothetical protein FNV43_RR07998 [Rhamnella rubrinervis]|uniref:Uncharacterized protein n=1 Tax=Rhamnella rubrinervis TaxID=2594499 RepID=A0A8K0HFY9_9ROSA|nr:hypothetical protein FNV43_RR07998 [Rhamnella rubrinervis]
MESNKEVSSSPENQKGLQSDTHNMDQYDKDVVHRDHETDPKKALIDKKTHQERRPSDDDNDDHDQHNCKDQSALMECSSSSSSAADHGDQQELRNMSSMDASTTISKDEMESLLNDYGQLAPQRLLSLEEVLSVIAMKPSKGVHG